MRLTLVLLVTICCLALTVKGVPVSLEEKTKDVPAPVPDTQPATEVKETGRQNEGAPAVAEEDDDDDDDDDDEDISDVLDDEDDDDDDDDEGGADDDDDDDDDYFESFFDGLIGEEDDDDDDDDEDNEVAAAAQPAQTPTAQDSVAQGAQQVASSGPIVSVGEETVPVANDELPDVDEAAASGIVTVDNNIDTIAKEPEVQGTVAAAPAQNYVDEDDDDDDDDDDVLEDALEVDDDDDDDEEDDDDDDLGEVLEARKARSVDQNVVPQELIKKYNKFVDGIIGRIRATMARSYDPVSVHLTNFEYKFKNKQREIPRGQDEEKPTSEVTPSEETATVKATEKATESERSNKKSTVKKTQRLQEKTKQNTARPTPKGTLFGLSKIARKGDVKVNRMADYESVKCDIILGPLQLKVEKSFGRGLRKELRLATATTQEMNGRITLRIVNGAATLHSIKVQQPKQVRIDSPDNHDKAREFIWKRSSKIAPIASRKLTRALKAMLSPPPKNKTL